MAPIRVASTNDIPPGTVSSFEVAGTLVAVANVEGTFYAIHDICSHAFALLSEGELDSDECTLECPMHGSIFDLATGRPRTLPAYESVPVYPITVAGEDVFVDVTK